MMTMTKTTTSVTITTPQSRQATGSLGIRGDPTQRRVPENRAPEPHLREARDPRLRLEEEDPDQRLKQGQGNLDQGLDLESTEVRDQVPAVQVPAVQVPGVQVPEDLDLVPMEQKLTDQVPGSPTTEPMEEQRDPHLDDPAQERQKPEHLGSTPDELARAKQVPRDSGPEGLDLAELVLVDLVLVEMSLIKELTDMNNQGWRTGMASRMGTPPSKDTRMAMRSRMGINHMTVSTIVFVPFNIFVGPSQSFYWAQDASMASTTIAVPLLGPVGNHFVWKIALFRMTLPSGWYTYPSQAQIKVIFMTTDKLIA